MNWWSSNINKILCKNNNWVFSEEKKVKLNLICNLFLEEGTSLGF